VNKLLLLVATSAVVVLMFASVASAQTYSMSASSMASSSAMMSASSTASSSASASATTSATTSATASPLPTTGGAPLLPALSLMASLALIGSGLGALRLARRGASS
jgi:trimeric autotransporter adhesin